MSGARTGRTEAWAGRLILLVLVAFTLLPFVSMLSAALQEAGSNPTGLQVPSNPEHRRPVLLDWYAGEGDPPALRYKCSESHEPDPTASDDAALLPAAPCLTDARAGRYSRVATSPVTCGTPIPTTSIRS